MTTCVIILWRIVKDFGRIAANKVIFFSVGLFVCVCESSASYISLSRFLFFSFYFIFAFVLYFSFFSALLFWLLLFGILYIYMWTVVFHSFALLYLQYTFIHVMRYITWNLLGDSYFFFYAVAAETWPCSNVYSIYLIKRGCRYPIRKEQSNNQPMENNNIVDSVNADYRDCCAIERNRNAHTNPHTATVADCRGFSNK